MKYWKTKDGKNLRPHEMADTHLLSTIKMLTPNGEEEAFEFNGDTEILELLLEEAEYRGLR